MRFAPSPTGVFHVGNLRTAWISHQWARHLQVPWVVRIEDIDKPRVNAQSQKQQLSDLMQLGLKPDILIVQSNNEQRHFKLLQDLLTAGLAYPCLCSRKKTKQALQEIASAPHQQVPMYDGHCRNLKMIDTNQTVGWRLRADNDKGFDDVLLGHSLLIDSLAADRHSFVPSYNWACAIDDYDGAYPLVVRAWDLDHVLLQQRNIQKKLATLEAKKNSPSAVFHCSLVVNTDGSRLEKRTMGVTLKEILTNGWSVIELLEGFASSFDHNHFQNLHEGSTFGEAARTIEINQLLTRAQDL